MIQQVSVFAENSKGSMKKITDILAAGDINIMGMVTSEAAEFGIIRMVVEKPEEAYKLLEDAGYFIHLDELIGIEMEDHPGSLDHILEALKEINVNVDYLYISFNRDAHKPMAVFHTESPEIVEQGLEQRGFAVI
ncbi:MAG: amino acid-binding protein [Lachnospiraceae bacterium]|nr:amino acid-binding protein [Lachnospiraceae bacterium]